jgi:hypothetical protein
MLTVDVCTVRIVLFSRGGGLEGVERRDGYTHR